MMPVYIPSYNRFEFKQARSLRLFNQVRGWKVFIVVRSNQYKRYSGILKQLDSWVTPVIVYKPGLTAARNCCVKHALSCGCSKMFMVDDDLAFFRRKPNEQKLCSLNSPRDMCKVVCRHLHNYAHVAISNRFGNAFEFRKAVEGVRGVRAVGYRVDILQKHRLGFDLCAGAREGMYMTLRLFRLRYPNLVLYNYAQESREPNVCDKDEQTMLEWTTASAKELERRFSNVVKHVQRNYKSGTRGEVRVQWKKALKEPRRILESTGL